MELLFDIVTWFGDRLADLIQFVTGARPGEQIKSLLDWVGTITTAVLGLSGVWMVLRRGGQATRDDVREVAVKVEQAATKDDIAELRRELQQALAVREASLDGAAVSGTGTATALPAPAVTTGAASDGVARDLDAAIDTLLAAGKVEALRDKTGEAAQQALDQLIAERSRARQRVTKDEAALRRQKGALAFLHDTKSALAAYATATDLDPDDAEGWNELGHLYRRTGDLDAAIRAYQRVLALGNSTADQTAIAVASGNLGLVYFTRGDLDGAEAMYRKAIAIEEALGRKEGMASDYGNLGNVDLTRGDLDRAEAMFRKSLAINEALGRKEGMAANYGNLGLLEQQRGHLAAACAYWVKSRDLFGALGSPTAATVEGWMRNAGCPEA